MIVFCLFHNYCDYECSAETLICIYESKSDAETGLLELVARGEKLKVEDQVFTDRFQECHVLYRNQKPATGLIKRYQEALQVIVDDQRVWRQENFGQDWSNIPETNLDAYEIQEVEIGKVRS